MSPLLDLQKRLVEIGRIRLGTTEATQRGKRRPVKLETWRLTSRDNTRLNAAASVYGGTVAQWDEAYELVTQTDQLEVMLIPGQALSQWWELWGQPGGQGAVSCLRRCDGEREILSDGSCLCPADYDERREAAQDGKACKPTTRLSVILPAVPGIGCWRLETRGYYAAVELAGAAGLLEGATAAGVLLPARLRIDQRSSRKAGQTRKYPVPVIEVDAPPSELLALGAGTTVAPQAALPAPAPAPEPEPEPVATISAAQRRKLFAAAREAELSEDDMRAIVMRVTGVMSTGEIPAEKLDALLNEIREGRAAA